MRKMQEESSSSSGHGRNEGRESSTNANDPRIEGKQDVDGEDKDQEVIENFINLEDNPDGDNENESAATNEEDESTENVENREETTMADYWNRQRVLQFCIERECIDTIVELFVDQLLVIDRGEVEKSKVRYCISGFRTAFMSHLEKFKKTEEEQELIEDFNNHEVNPDGDNEQETVGTNEEDESTENVEHHEETTMAEYWNPQRVLQFCIELECVDTIVELFVEQLLVIDRSDVEWSKVFDSVCGFGTAFLSCLEKFKKMKEEASSFSSQGRNKGQETTENAEIWSGNPDEEHKLTVNEKIHEEERTIENLEENPVTMEEKQREEAGVSVNMEERGIEKAAGSSSHGINEEQESTENGNNHEEQKMPKNANNDLFQFYMDKGLREAKPIKRPYKKRR